MSTEMKNAVILHGSGETPESFWLPYAKRELEAKGYSVSIPQLPDSEVDPDVNKCLPVALQETYTEDTVLIGHSAGCPLILSVLENINVRVKQAILVAGFSIFLPEDNGVNPILQESYDWARIADHVEDIIFINSDNDPWGCDDKQGRHMLDSLGKGKLIIMKGEGHMGSDRFSQPYKEFPFLMKLID